VWIAKIITVAFNSAKKVFPLLMATRFLSAACNESFVEIYFVLGFVGPGDDESKKLLQKTFPFFLVGLDPFFA
jgi:hypothetical protein